CYGAERAGCGNAFEARSTHKNACGSQSRESAVPVVGDVQRAIEVEDQEQHRWKQNERTTNNLGGDQSNDTTQGEAESDGKSLHNPGMNTEDTEAEGVEKVSAGCNEFEKIAVQNLTVHDPQSTSKEENLVANCDKRCSGKQEGS